jgi:hydrogenase maturation protein HypF
VQGVGFRPAIYRAATAFGVRGFVANSAQGAVIEIEGAASDVRAFLAGFSGYLPSNALVTRITKEKRRLQQFKDFSIAKSTGGTAISADLPADLSICPDCHRELLDPGDRRYLYPFINCTNCGPRFTIVKELPYDRHKTTMAGFSMCAACGAEYGDPGDRRFHAQPDACPVCGPRLKLVDGKKVLADGQDALIRAVALLYEGAILAIKSLGGYHLACDAYNPRSLKELRKRKERQHKPFALMLPDIASVKTVCEVDAAEQSLLLSPQRPIVLLKKHKAIEKKLPTADLLAPENAYLGVMLPYTPLHVLLFTGTGGRHPRSLVMTSGNRRDEPICCTDADAYEKLGGIADYFLVHNRPIQNRCDDSIVQVVPGSKETVFIRRSRGYVPTPVELSRRSAVPIFAAGAELKNAFCITRGRQAYMSPYIGDLDSRESLDFYNESFGRYAKFLAVKPAAVACDLHPDYQATLFATRYAAAHRIKKVTVVQHHQAHIASVLAEKEIDRPVIGFAFDGTGFGHDGAIWGAECFVYDGANFLRRAHIEYFPLPGGDRATREIWRIALALLRLAGITKVPLHIRRGNPVTQVFAMMNKGINSPLCCSAGRLFDGIAALAGLRTVVNFEAQAAVGLEAAATEAVGRMPLPWAKLDKHLKKGYNFNIIRGDSARKNTHLSGRPHIVTLAGLVESICRDREQGVRLPLMSARFHVTLAEVIGRLADMISTETGIKEVALSGGVFQNRLLFGLAVQRLRDAGFKVHFNTMVPPNDGGVALGQAWCAMRRSRED